MIRVLILFEFDFQSPHRKNADIQARANVWAVPCDGGKPECVGGEDENRWRCTIPEELTFLSLVLCYLFLFVCMLCFLLYKFGR